MTMHCNFCLMTIVTGEQATYCSKCQEFLCSYCTEGYSCNHDKTAYKDVPKLLQQIPLTCQLHCQKYEYYCQDHDAPVCRNCLKTKHQQCSDMPRIETITCNVKTSVAFEHVITDVNAMYRVLRNVAKDRTENLTQLERKKHTIDAGSSLIDRTFNKHMDIIKSTIREIQNKQMEIGIVKDQITKIKKTASDFQTYMSIKIMENLVSEAKVLLEHFKSSGGLDHICISLQRPNALQRIFRKPSSVGIRVSVKASKIQLDINDFGGAQDIIYRYGHSTFYI